MRSQYTRSEYTGYISRTSYLQLDQARQDALSTYAASLLEQQRADEKVRAHGALTWEQIMGMTLADVERHAMEIGATASAVIRAAEPVD